MPRCILAGRQSRGVIHPDWCRSCSTQSYIHIFFRNRIIVSHCLNPHLHLLPAVPHSAYTMLAPDSNPAEPDPARSGPVPTKPHRFRSSSGCLTCRLRKKKCDERKPKCIACTRNCQQCTWPAAPMSRNVRDPVPYVVPQERTSSPDQVDTSVRWSIRTGSFLSPLRASALTDISNILFAHYLAETGSLLSALPPGGNNPFLTVLVPLCCNDDLLMHSLLALSGSHMGFQSTGIEVYMATCRHYSIAIRTLRNCICDFTAMDASRAMRILLALMMLSVFEVSVPINSGLTLK